MFVDDGLCGFAGGAVSGGTGGGGRQTKKLPATDERTSDRTNNKTTA